MCYVELEPAEVWEEKKRKARKAHKCNSCLRTIAKGEVYHTHFSIYEDSPTSNKICAECFADRAAFGDAHDCVGTPEYFPRMLAECVSEGDPGDARWRPMLERINASREQHRVRL
jgi:hypothetical protein